MADETRRPDETKARKPARRTSWDRCKDFLTRVNQRFAFVVGLPVVGALGTFLIGHFDYLSSYQDKLRVAANDQVSAAETAFVDISGKFAKAITLQQILYFNYRDAIKGNKDGDGQALETRSARELYKQYDELRTELRESIDLLARRAEMTLDWSSDPDRDPAQNSPLTTDPINRIALGNYDFDCDDAKYMPSFEDGQSSVDLPPPPRITKKTAAAKPLTIDWFSAKHQLITLYYCFEHNHARIAAARAWAASSPVDAADRKKFIDSVADTQESFDREAVRLQSFMTLSASAIEYIRVKFRPRTWFCHVPFLREAIDAVSKRCTPLRIAHN